MREEYLDVWKKNPYPPSAGKYFSASEAARFQTGRMRIGARVLQAEAGKLVLNWEGGTLFLICPPLIELAPGFRATQILGEGDLIEAILWKNERAELLLEAVALLVPSLTENPFPNVEFHFKRARQWQEYIQAIRGFFVSRDFVELRTPTLVPSPGLEPFLDPFQTRFKMGGFEKTCYLPTSPEFHLKKAVAMGYTRCFEFKECFRNGELSPHHQPEFLMLEWYRSFADTEAMIRDVAALLEKLQTLFLEKAEPVSVMTLEDLFRREFEFELTPQTTLGQLKELCRSEGLQTSPDDDFDEVFMRIFVERIETRLGRQGPFILYHFPPSQAALARLTPEGWADRFELFWGGLEIANAFHELNDPVEQRRRFARDQEKKKQLGKDPVPVDEEFLRALEYGLPPSVGIALGVERLFMALFNLGNLEETRLFPFRKNGSS